MFTSMKGMADEGLERIVHAFRGEVAVGVDEEGVYEWQAAPRDECLNEVVERYKQMCWAAKDALAAGRAIERMMEAEVGHGRMNEIYSNIMESYGHYKYLEDMNDEKEWAGFFDPDFKIREVL